MAKSGSPKNTKNKALHSKLMDQKKNKLRKSKNKNTDRIKAMTSKFQENIRKENTKSNKKVGV